MNGRLFVLFKIKMIDAVSKIRFTIIMIEINTKYIRAIM